ncbi:MAG: tRNA (cytosine(32)/uridine(32)-2'-O)-methyltransferase TrmJ [Candidatus Competibacteraceae bacterium]|nr:tRNA (cytosine(32)/uridine(32)-2'-O)-methyltransferase TrmJ [Candidatus Competibacteraceae bacterium]
MNLHRVQVILVETSHPGNIGAVARAMKTMCLERLVLVNPAHFPHSEAIARATGAVDVLERAQVVDNLADALMGCQLVIGATARQRGMSAPVLEPRECATLATSQAEQVEVAVVFGRERSGLHNKETDQCNFLVRIPTNPAFSSLNLAAAVQVLTYELHLAARSSQTSTMQQDSVQLAPADEMARLYHHLEHVLLTTGFLDPTNPRLIMRRLRRLFNRAQPDQREVNILRGILTSVQQALRHPS